MIPLDSTTIANTYVQLIGRTPRDRAEVDGWIRNHHDYWSFLKAFCETPEYTWHKSIDLHHVAALNFDDFCFCLKHTVPVQQRAGFVTSAFGICTRTHYAEKWAALDGTIAKFLPDKCFEFDSIEWYGALRSVDRAESCYVVVELGAGWGPWMTAGSVFARRRGIDQILAVGVEGDQVRRSFIAQHRFDNGVADIPHLVHEGVVAPQSGSALFPELDESTADMGIAAIYDDRRQGLRKDYRGVPRNHVEVRAFSLAEILCSVGSNLVDLMHVDIQGGELDVIETSVELVDSRCRHLLIATHSREIEWQIARVLMRSGWVLEKERPCGMHFGDSWRRSGRDWPLVNRDGTQFWRNPALVK